MLILKKDLPTAKAGTEINHSVGEQYLVDNCRERVMIPDNVFDEWVEDTEKPWEPKMGEWYFFPQFSDGEKQIQSQCWENNERDKRLFELSFICRSVERANALAERMLEAVKK